MMDGDDKMILSKFERLKTAVSEQKWFEPFLLCEMMLHILLLLSAAFCYLCICSDVPIVQALPVGFLIVNGLLLLVHWYSWGLPIQARLYKSVLGSATWLIFFVLWVLSYPPFNGVYVLSFILFIYTSYESVYWYKKIKKEHNTGSEVEVK